MGIIDDNEPYRDMDREMLERIEADMNIDLVGHDDGVLRDGVFRYGEIPVAAWSEKDFDKVKAWFESLGLIMSEYQYVEVHHPTMTLYPFHFNTQGKVHVAGHCNGESTFIDLAPATNLLSGDYLTARCSGCGMHLGEISKTQQMADYSKMLDDRHEVCMSEPVEVEIDP